VVALEAGGGLMLDRHGKLIALVTVGVLAWQLWGKKR
jgi:hypothetical protein